MMSFGAVIAVVGGTLGTIFAFAPSDDERGSLQSSIQSNFPGLEVEVQQGGQQHYPFILSVE